MKASPPRATLASSDIGAGGIDAPPGAAGINSSSAGTNPIARGIIATNDLIHLIADHTHPIGDHIRLIAGGIDSIIYRIHLIADHIDAIADHIVRINYQADLIGRGIILILNGIDA